jgi:alpha-mannosidase
MSFSKTSAGMLAILTVIALTPLTGLEAQTATNLLWQIGEPDGKGAEFALAPDGYAQYGADPFFVIGQSDPKRDWPYVQPGPADSWAGSQPHTFSVLFGLRETPGPGTCQLQVKLVDTHYSSPPQLRVQINGQAFEQALPKGGSDASIRGQPEQGRPSQFQIAFPSDLLHLGDNDIQITTQSGSWLAYDWLGLTTPAGAQLGVVQARTLVARVQSIRGLRELDGRPVQPIQVTLRHFGPPQEAAVRVEGMPSVPVRMTSAEQTVELAVPAVQSATTQRVVVEVEGRDVASRDVTVRPVRKLTIYVLPHSHTDIGYTEIQTAIEKKQVNNLLEGIAAARRTADYPEGARFVWNVEVLWAADLYLHRLNDAQRAEFFEAVQKGWVGLNGMYLNELTGLCRPEELLQLFGYATRLSEQCGVTIDSAMISDVPGYTWGTVTAMAQAGIRYFSTAPNYFDRIGDILQQWENKPFWWSSPSGRERVLVWIPYMGYAMSHLIHHFTPQFVDDYQTVLEKENYPYDIAYVRWSGHGDNAVPDPAICEFVKEWNSTYAWPRFVIARTSDAFRDFEQHYGGRLPVVRGDWTPYWEDGAGSSALETGLNRNSSDRLVQAEALFAMAGINSSYPAGAFEQAWRHALLYSEHTWGADCSVSDPESQKTREQWAIKKSYADAANLESRALLQQGLSQASKASDPGTAAVEPGAIDLFNTTSWTRTELVCLPKQLSSAGDQVKDGAGRLLPSQRLTDGTLAFIALEVPPFSSKRYTVLPGEAKADASLNAAPAQLDNGLIRVRVDEKTGAIVELAAIQSGGNLADTNGLGDGLNDFLFLPGEDLKNLERCGPVTLSVIDKGPVVASLLVRSSAPGCNELRREVRVVAGLGYVELLDTVDKKRAAIPSKPGDGAFAQKGGKESVNFAFPFQVPNGEVSLDIPLGWMRPELDQMPSACKNWFTVGRWADVANADYGVTLVTLDAPLLEVGGITANLTGSQTNPKVWRKKVEPTQRLYVWAMNNHWHTNYRAYQEGPVTFRFVLRPHGQPDPAETTRFATGFSQPLLAIPAHGRPPSGVPRLQIDQPGVVVTSFKPSDDGKAWILRLFGASGKDQNTRITWADPKPSQVWLTNTREKPIQPMAGAILVPAWDIVTLRIEVP